MRLFFASLTHLLVHEVFLAVLPALLLVVCARSVTAWGLLLTFAEKAIKAYLQAIHDSRGARTRTGDLQSPRLAR